MNDPHFKKTIEFEGRGFSLSLRVAHDLFSSHDVDRGTRLLLGTLNSPEFERTRRILDMGCGYGPIGLALKALDSSRTVHMVDRDALALEYARANAGLNNLEVSAYGSLGYDDVPARDFDMIVSNIPGKAGPQVIEHLLKDAAFFLVPEGIVAIVIVSALAESVRAMLSDSEILASGERGGHTWFHFQPAEVAGDYVPALERGVYARGSAALRWGERELEVQTVHGLAEFDSLRFETELMLEAISSLQTRGGTAAFWNPGQGHLPVFVRQHVAPAEIAISDRDLLALRQTERNLGGSGASWGHRGLPEPMGEVDLAILPLREKEPSSALQFQGLALFETLKPSGTLVAGGSSTEITRLAAKLEAAGGRLGARRKRKGRSAIAVSKAGRNHLSPR